MKIRVILKERRSGVKTVFTNITHNAFIEGAFQVRYTDDRGKTRSSTFPLDSILAVEAEDL